MIERVPFNPFSSEANPDDIASAHVLLSYARGIKSRDSVGEALEDLKRYAEFAQGTRSRPPGLMLYKDPEHRTVGLMYGTEFPASRRLSIGAIAVEKQFRGMGYGANILDDAISWSQSRDLGIVQLDVARDNKTARNLYDSRSFVPVEGSDGSYLSMVRINS